LAGIQIRLVIAFLAVTTIPVVIVSIYASHEHLTALERLALNAASEAATVEARQLQDALAGAQGDLFYLSQIASLDTFIEAARSGEPTNVAYARDKLARQFEAFVASRPTYRAAAYIDAERRVSVRVQRTGTQTAVVPSEARADATMPEPEHTAVPLERLLPGQTVTQVDPEGADAVVRLMTRMAPRGAQRRGMVVLESRLSALWHEENEGGPMTRLVLLDATGRVIVGRVDVLPEGTLDALSAQPGRPLVVSTRHIVTYVPIHPNPTNLGEQWAVLAIAPSDLLFGAMTRYRRVFTVVLLLALAVVGVVSILLARQFTVPLRRLYDAAQDIGRGRFDVHLDDTTGDEIAGLAGALRTMADQLKVRHDALQRQVDDKTRELLRAEQLSTIGTMSAAIAHEVNNPLGIISLYSQLLAEQTPPDDPRTEKLQTIAREASRISVLVGGLLQFARQSELRITSVNPATLIERAAVAASSLHDPDGLISVKIDVDPDPTTIEADGDQLQQVLQNLLVNAMHAMPDGGTVTVTARGIEADTVELTVRDTGSGIDSDQLPRIFEPFFTTRRFGAGTGLGLAVSRQIVERHGGTIYVRSTPGSGTCFVIRLPRRAAPTDTPEHGGNPE
jgi:signal transduction histidine kinase